MCAQMYSTEGEASPRGPPYTTSLSTATLTAQPNSALHPVYRVLDTSGKVIDPSQEPQVLASTLPLCLYSFMISLLYCVLVTIRDLLLVLVDILRHACVLVCSQLSKESLVKMYQQMVTLSIMDQHLYKAQRMVKSTVIIL